MLKRYKIEYNSEAFGAVFEHYILQEITAYSHYSGKNFKINYWHTASQLEVDFILADHEVAIEVKVSNNIAEHHLRGIKAFREEYKTKHSIVISLDPKPRLSSGIWILPWKEFLERLWNGEII